jgi:hypothetical protein
MQITVRTVLFSGELKMESDLTLTSLLSTLVHNPLFYMNDAHFEGAFNNLKFKDLIN